MKSIIRNTIRGFLLLAVVLTAGCTKLYTQDQVNATVGAKILEVAGYQKVNVTVETVIVKEYVVVTATPAPSATPGLFVPTYTPIGFNRYESGDIFAELTRDGFPIRQTFYEIELETFGTAGLYIQSASHFNVLYQDDSYLGIIYAFETEKQLEMTYDILRSRPTFDDGKVYRVGNFLLEIEGAAPVAILDEFAKLSASFLR